MTPTEQRTLAIVEDLVTGDSYAVACRLWPHWRTSRGRIPAAAEGRAFKFLHQLREKGLIELDGNKFRALTRSEPALFQLRSE